MQKEGIVFTVTAISCIVLLSGCVGGQADQASGGPEAIPDAAGPAKFDESTGAIQGLITNDQIQPVPGAQVGLVELGITTISDVGGRFVLSNLVPGRYSLGASALGYNAIARSVEVRAGEATEVNLVITPIPVLEPYAELFPFTGYIGCAFAFVRSTYSPLPVAGSCSTTEETQNWQWIYGQEEGDGWPVTWAGTLVEAEWDNQANPDWLAFDYVDREITYLGTYFRYRGTSPVRFLVERCGDYRDTDFGRSIAPCTDEEVEASRMHLETFYVGKYQEETHNLDAACTGNITNPVQGGNVFPGYQAGCYGVGPGLNLRWQNWVTVFHLELPSDVDVYSARPDA